MSSGINLTGFESDLIELIVKIDPVFGTQLGLQGEHNGWLPPVEKTHREAILTDLQKRVNQFDGAAEGSLSANDAIDFELAVGGARSLRILDAALRPYERNPDWYLETAMTGLYSLLTRVDMSMDEKIIHIGSRLAGIPSHLRTAREQIIEPLRVLVETAAGDVGGARSFCIDALGEFIATIPNHAAQRELTEARRLCLEAIEDYAVFIDSLREKCYDDFAVGESAFNALLEETHRIPYRAGELIELGYRVTQDLERELEEFSHSLAGHARWWETLGPLSANHPTRETLIDDYKNTVNEARRFVEEQGLVDLSPASPLDMQPTPPFARANLPFAAYIPAPPFASNGRAQFWITPVDGGIPEHQAAIALSQHHAGRILVACVHEAYPGHHVQFSHAAKVPRALRHIFTSTVFIEGWGLYSEDLMRLAGFSRGDSQSYLLQMSQLRDQLWRALRVVLDVGLHCNGMTQEEATDMLVNKHVLDRDSAAAEVMYYCSAPTQPMSYTVGKLLIENLIERCGRTGDDRFGSLYQIHNQILSHGSLPFPLLERALGIV